MHSDYDDTEDHEGAENNEGNFAYAVLDEYSPVTSVGLRDANADGGVVAIVPFPMCELD